MVRRTRALEAAHAEATGRPLIATSQAMRRVLAVVEQIARSAATALIHGESGTGKELIARAIHAQSARRGHPLVAVNCAALPDTLVESELFGHEKGAFTGAMTRKPGKLELADGGTQEREVERLGGSRPIPVDVHVLAATNQDLRKLVGERRFREDLYYRLNVVTMELPPLRERSEPAGLRTAHVRSLASRRDLANVANDGTLLGMGTMNISLPGALKDFVDRQVARKGYGSVSDYVRDLIRRDQVQQAERHLAELIRQGLESGPARPVDARYWAAKRARLLAPASKRSDKA